MPTLIVIDIAVLIGRRRKPKVKMGVSSTAKVSSDVNLNRIQLKWCPDNDRSFNYEMSGECEPCSEMQKQ